jgi:hypothetical protein
VNEIIALNKEGEKPDDISIKKETPKVKLPDFENVVGQDSLTRFDNAKKKKKKKKKKPLGATPNANPNQVIAQERPVIQQNKPKPANVPAKEGSNEVKAANDQQKRPNRNNNNRNRNNNNRPPKPPAEA